MPMRAGYIYLYICDGNRGDENGQGHAKKAHEQILSYIQMYALALRTSSSVASLTFTSLTYAHCRSGLDPLDDFEEDIDGATRVAEETELAEGGFGFAASSSVPDEADVAGWSGIAVYAM